MPFLPTFRNSPAHTVTVISISSSFATAKLPFSLLSGYYHCNIVKQSVVTWRLKQVQLEHQVTWKHHAFRRFHKLSRFVFSVHGRSAVTYVRPKHSRICCSLFNLSMPSSDFNFRILQESQLADRNLISPTAY